MSELPESEYKNQKCACFIEIERLESQNESLRRELAEAKKEITHWQELAADEAFKVDDIERKGKVLVGAVERFTDQCHLGLPVPAWVEVINLKEALAAFKEPKG